MKEDREKEREIKKGKGEKLRKRKKGISFMKTGSIPLNNQNMLIKYNCFFWQEWRWNLQKRSSSLTLYHCLLSFTLSNEEGRKCKRRRERERVTEEGKMDTLLSYLAKKGKKWKFKVLNKKCWDDDLMLILWVEKTDSDWRKERKRETIRRENCFFSLWIHSWSERERERNQM